MSRIERPNSIEQGNGEVRLQFAQRPAEGGLADAKLVRRPRHVLEAGDYRKVFQLRPGERLHHGSTMKTSVRMMQKSYRFKYVFVLDVIGLIGLAR